MAVYAAPEGFRYDERSGLYINNTQTTDPTGAPIMVFTTFNADTGEYRQTCNRIMVDPPPRRAVVKKSKAPLIIGIAAAVLVLGAGVFFGGKYLLNASGNASSPLAKITSKKSDDIAALEAPKVVDNTLGTYSAGGSAGMYGDDGDPYSTGGDGYDSSQDSYEAAALLAAYLHNTGFIKAGDTYDLSEWGLRNVNDYRPYEFYFEFDPEGNVSYIYEYYLSPEDAAKMKYDRQITHDSYQGITTLDKWMEGDKTVCIRFSYAGYTATIKLDFNNKTESLYLDDVASSADPNCLLAYCDNGSTLLYTPEDIESIKKQLGIDR